MSIVKLFSRNCYVDNRLQPATLICEEGVIKSIFCEQLRDADDLGDAVIMPGVIDVHVHINEPGRTEWEGFQTATRAAAAGGIVTLVDMPLNSSPVTTSLSALQEKRKATEGKLSVHVGFYGGIVPGNAQEIEPLAAAGVLGFKCFLVHSGIDEFPHVTEQDLDIAMPLLASAGLPLLAHCEIPSGDHSASLSRAPQSYMAYLDSRPGEWELNAVEMMIRLCRKHKCRIHIVHVSFAETLERIRLAKEEGLPITAETCPHYIFFNAEEIPDANTLYKCAPPIRGRKNNEALKHALASGVLDFLASDHSPAPPDIKELQSGNLAKAWGGIAGLQMLLSASWTALKKEMSLEQFIPLLTKHPASFLQMQNRGELKEGNVADITIWDPQEGFVPEPQQILHRHAASPYLSHHMFGKVLRTYVNGQKVYDGNTVKSGNGLCISGS